MEKQIKIKSKDGKTIYSVLNSEKKSDKLIIFVHGLAGHINEHKFYNAVSYFNKKGFDTLRVCLYGDENGARKLRDTTLSLHGKDIERVREYFKKRYKTVYGVGHSFGGPSILLSNPNQFDAVVLWDPTYETPFSVTSEDEIRFEKSLGHYVIDWGLEIIIGKKMVEEAEKLDTEKLWKTAGVPSKIIVAGKGWLRRYKKEFQAWADEVMIVKGADHNFNPEGTEKELHDETYKFLKKQI